MKFLDLIHALRPRQWTKNAVIFAPIVFAMGDATLQIPFSNFGKVAWATACFCMASSGVYLINDLKDREQDRAHPFKKYRPIAAGKVRPGLAGSISIGLILSACVLGYTASPELAQVLGGYVALQLAYTFLIKRLAMIDVLVIASGFVLRAIAGAVVIGVTVSPWLLICTFFLAIFLGLCKRRQEFVDRDMQSNQATRRSLDPYDERLLDQLIGMIASCTLLCYSVYTLDAETVEKFGTTQLSFTLPFVIFGLFRYLYLVYRRDLGERPEEVLLTDMPLLIDLALYGLTVIYILH